MASLLEPYVPHAHNGTSILSNSYSRIDEACCGNVEDINSGTCNTVEDGCNNCIDE